MTFFLNNSFGFEKYFNTFSSKTNIYFKQIQIKVDNRLSIDHKIIEIN